jgi:hypothetical protein
MHDLVDEPVRDDLGGVTLLQPGDGALQLHEVVVKITHHHATPQILTPESLVPKEYVVGDIDLECQALKVDAGLNPGVAVAGQRVGEPQTVPGTRRLRLARFSATPP